MPALDAEDVDAKHERDGQQCREAMQGYQSLSNFPMQEPPPRPYTLETVGILDELGCERQCRSDQEEEDLDGVAGEMPLNELVHTASSNAEHRPSQAVHCHCAQH